MKADLLPPNPLRRRKQRKRLTDLQGQLHGELFSLERLEEYARELALEHKAITRRVPAKPLLAKAEKSGQTLEMAYISLAEASSTSEVPTKRRQRPLMPGDEWLLDNYHIVRDTVAEVMRDQDIVKKLVERGYETVTNTPQEHQAQTEALVAQWIEVGRKVNLKE